MLGWDLDDERTRAREIRALQAAMRRFALDSGTIVTADHDETITVPEGRIDAVSAWRWLLDN